MSFDGLFTARLSRRSLLTIAGAVLPLSAVGFAPMGLAQETAKPATIAAPQQFSFDLLTERNLPREGLVTAFEKLAKLGGGESSMFDSHPGSSDRAANMRTRLAAK